MCHPGYDRIFPAKPVCLHCHVPPWVRWDISSQTSMPPLPCATLGTMRYFQPNQYASTAMCHPGYDGIFPAKPVCLHCHVPPWVRWDISSQTSMPPLPCATLGTMRYFQPNQYASTAMCHPGYDGIFPAKPVCLHCHVPPWVRWDISSQTSMPPLPCATLCMMVMSAFRPPLQCHTCCRQSALWSRKHDSSLKRTFLHHASIQQMCLLTQASCWSHWAGVRFNPCRGWHSWRLASLRQFRTV